MATLMWTPSLETRVSGHTESQDLKISLPAFMLPKFSKKQARLGTGFSVPDTLRHVGTGVKPLLPEHS
jgi:hypothetical protein